MAAEGHGLERIRIARARVGNMRPLIGLLTVALVTIVGTGGVAIARGSAAAMPFTIVAMLAAVLAVIVYVNLPGSVVIGADGMLIDRRDDQRFVAFADVLAVEPHVEHTMGKTFVGALLRLRDETTLVLPIGEDHLGGSERADQLVSRLTAALSLYEERAKHAPETTDLLLRGDRVGAQWLERLRGVGEGANAGHREAPISVDRLWQIVESPAAPGGARASAAAALSPKLDDHGKKRMRIALEDTAAPKLRIALERALTDDDEALLQALDAIEHEELTERRRPTG